MSFSLTDNAFKQHKSGGGVTNFCINDIDESGATKYYGYENEEGRGIIMEVTATTVRYYNVEDHADYLTAWTGRAGLGYAYYSEIF